MNCQDVHKFVYVYLDDEFDASERLEFEAHLLVCSKCRALVSEEQTFKQLFKRSIEPTKAPSNLRQQIVGSIRQMRAANRPKRILSWAYRVVPATAAAAVVTLVLLQAFWPTTNEIAPLADESVEAHRQQLPPDVGGDPVAVQNFVRSRVPFHSTIPLRENPSLKLVGARISHFQGRPAVLYFYQHGSSKLTVVQFFHSTAEILGNRAVRFLTRRGYNMAIFRDGKGVTNSVISDLDQSTLMKMLPVSGP